MSDIIYLDNQATTPTDPRVRDAMLPFLSVDSVGNPHSEHFAGRRAARAVEEARAQVAELIGANSEEIYFTSGATEANNIAIQGVARSGERRGNRIVTLATEHSCVLHTVAFLGREGVSVDILPVRQSGIVSIDALSDAIAENTFLVSVMAANNEIGVLQPLQSISAICRNRGSFLHTDAAQAVGKIPINVKALGVDSLSVSGHKIYAPIGIGALYVSEDAPIRPAPLFWGGGQERNLRSGTLPTHLCVGFGVACAIASRELRADADHAMRLREDFFAALRERCPRARINGDPDIRLPGNLSITIPGVDADRLVGSVQPRIAISATAACSSGILQPSHVLLALGLSREEASSTIRVGFGRFNTAAEAALAAAMIADVALRIRSAGENAAA